MDGLLAGWLQTPTSSEGLAMDARWPFFFSLSLSLVSLFSLESRPKHTHLPIHHPQVLSHCIVSYWRVQSMHVAVDKAYAVLHTGS